MLIGAGSLCVGLAILGVVLPVLPTTPFLLLAAACFVRSSRRLYTWLHENRLFGAFIKRYRSGEGISLGFKIRTIVLLWLSLGTSAFFAVPERLWLVRGLLLAVGTGVTIHLCRVKTYSPDRFPPSVTGMREKGITAEGK